MIEKTTHGSLPGKLAGAGLALALALLSAGCGAKPSSIRVTPGKLTFYGIKKSQIVKVEVLDKKGRVLEGTPVSWESSKPNVATVESTGLVRSAGAGSTVLTVKTEGASATLSAVVHDVAAVHVSPSRMTLAGAKGSTAPLWAEVLDSAGKPVDLKPEWTSSDAKVATVSPEGVVTGVSEGRVSVTAALGDVGGSVDVRILFREIASFEVSPQTVPLKSGDSQRLTVLALDPAGTAIEDVAVVWTSTDPKTAVCANGVVRGISPGTATIRATCGPKSAEVSVLVF